MLCFSSAGLCYYFLHQNEEDINRRKVYLRDWFHRNENDDHWRLLRIAHSKNLNTRQFGVNAIAESVDMPGYCSKN